MKAGFEKMVHLSSYMFFFFNMITLFYSDFGRSYIIYISHTKNINDSTLVESRGVFMIAFENSLYFGMVGLYSILD